MNCEKELSEKQIKKNKKYCSRKCCTDFNRYSNVRYINSKKRKSIPCLQCGKERKIKPWKLRLGRGKFCSKACESEYKKIKFILETEKLGKFKISNHNREPRKYLLFKNGNKCQICNNTEWQGKPIPLTVDHIDGHWDNTRIENYRLICPNCDRQLPTFGSKNKGNGKPWRREYNKLKNLNK